MANVCEICGKKTIFGHRVSHAHNLTNRRWKPNLQKVHVVIEGKRRTLKVCASCLRKGKLQKVKR